MLFRSHQPTFLCPPLIFAEIAASGPSAKGTFLFYGHFDKQPHLTKDWREGLHPTKPVIEDGKLYGRGGADDGYSIFATMTALKIVQEQGLPHPRCIFIMEGDEESASGDVEYYLEKYHERFGEISLITILDSGCADYSTLWVTTTLRGCLKFNLNIAVSTEGIHSGEGSGTIPECFRISRILLNRLEDVETGKMHEKLRVKLTK